MNAPIGRVMARARGVTALLVLVVVATACGSQPSGAGGDGTSELSGELLVFAASSLTEAFTDVGEAFMAEHEDVTIRFSFTGSDKLVAQILEGAPADVFASADVANMQRLVDAGVVAAVPSVFAHNQLGIIVEEGNPQGIAEVADLADPDLVVLTCGPENPIGPYTQEVLDSADVIVTPKSLEDNIKAVVNKVVLGEADAGIVYATDIVAAGDDATGVPIPDEHNVVVEYPAATVAESDRQELGGAFIAFLTGPEGQELIEARGFSPR